GGGQSRAPRRRQRGEAVDHFAHERRERRGLRRDVRRLPLRAREVQQVLDQVREATRLLIDDREGTQPLLVGAHAPEHEGLGEHADLRERRPQFVRHAGDEIRAQARELRFAAQLNQGRPDQRGGQAQQPEDQWQAGFGKTTDNQLIGDRGPQGRLRVEVAHVRADGVSRGKWRRVLYRRAIDLYAVAVGDDDRPHRIVLNTAGE